LTEFRYIGGNLDIVGNCLDYATCRAFEQRNYDLCNTNNNMGQTTCQFCNPAKLSNNRDVISKYV